MMKFRGCKFVLYHSKAPCCVFTLFNKVFHHIVKHRMQLTLYTHHLMWNWMDWHETRRRRLMGICASEWENKMFMQIDTHKHSHAHPTSSARQTFDSNFAKNIFICCHHPTLFLSQKQSKQFQCSNRNNSWDGWATTSDGDKRCSGCTDSALSLNAIDSFSLFRPSGGGLFMI